MLSAPTWQTIWFAQRAPSSLRRSMLCCPLLLLIIRHLVVEGYGISSWGGISAHVTTWGRCWCRYGSSCTRASCSSCTLLTVQEGRDLERRRNRLKLCDGSRPHYLFYTHARQEKEKKRFTLFVCANARVTCSITLHFCVHTTVYYARSM